MRTKISRITSVEQNWIDLLLRSDLLKEVEKFTATEGMNAIAQTPLKSGRLPSLVPQSNKLNKVLNKSSEFEKAEPIDINKVNFWRLAQ